VIIWAGVGDGAEVAVHGLGGRGPTVLLAHATSFCAQVWRPLAERLGGSFRCLALDHRGHGDSSPLPAGPVDWHILADDVLAVADRLNLRPLLGVGHSAGGAALLLAEEDRPGTFAALYLYEPIVSPADRPPPPDPDHPLATAARRRVEVFPSRQAAYDHYAGKPPFSAFSEAALAAYVEHAFAELDDGSVQLKCRGADEARVYAGGLSHDAYAHLDRVRCPTVVARGQHSRAFGAEVAPALAARLPDARVEELPGLGHYGPMEDPDAVAAAVVRAFAGARPVT
jgi:pimeloyl-ACP methyl ester carboxylesterase